MRKTIAIICEYNPFHNGHKHQIDKLRESFADATIVAIMSGNTTQRGEFSIFDKYIRAKSAVLCGVNAVFEMPYPYSCASAEVFARAGVEIAKEIGADYLCFGSESDDIDNLKEIASIIDSSAFESEMSEVLKDKLISYSVARERALKRLGKEIPKDSNDILAIEYLRAIDEIAPHITPYPIKRVGEGYKSDNLGELMSASAIRKSFYAGNGLLSVPECARQALDNQNYLDISKSEDFLFRSILMTEPSQIEQYYDVPSGCGYFISDIAKKSNGAREFFDSLSSKTYTSARLRRIVMYASTALRNVDKSVQFTSLLAVDKIGREHLKTIKKTAKIAILTKHSDAKKLTENAYNSYELSKKADELYYTLLSEPVSASEAYKKSTIII